MDVSCFSTEQHKQVPTFGTALEEHLRRTNREIATVLDDCIATIVSIGLEEEGLFRIAGSSSKVKKLKVGLLTIILVLLLLVLKINYSNKQKDTAKKIGVITGE